MKAASVASCEVFSVTAA